MLSSVFSHVFLCYPQMKNFKPLLDMMGEVNPEVKITVRKLVTVSLLEVFKDLLPSYYIKLLDMEKVTCKFCVRRLIFKVV